MLSGSGGFWQNLLAKSQNHHPCLPPPPPPNDNSDRCIIVWGDIYIIYLNEFYLKTKEPVLRTLVA